MEGSHEERNQYGRLWPLISQPQVTPTPNLGENPSSRVSLSCIRASISSPGLNATQPRSVTRYFYRYPTIPLRLLAGLLHPLLTLLIISSSQPAQPFSLPLLPWVWKCPWRKILYVWNDRLYECVIPISPNSWTSKLFYFFPINCHRHLRVWRVWWKG